MGQFSLPERLVREPLRCPTYFRSARGPTDVDEREKPGLTLQINPCEDCCNETRHESATSTGNERLSRLIKGTGGLFFALAEIAGKCDSRPRRGDEMAATSFDAIKAPWPRSLEFPGTVGGLVLPSRLFTWTLRILCVTALVITGYLAITALRSEDVAGCSGTYWDCSHVLHSRWSKVFTLPVSIPAFGLYTILLAALTVSRQAAFGSRLIWAWGIVTVGAIAAGIAAIWFISLQVFSVGHLCAYCLAAHGCGLALCLGIVWKAPLGARMTAKLAGLSVLGAGALIAAQVMAAPPPTYKIEHFPNPAVTNAAPPAATKAAPDAKPAEKSHAAQVFEPPSD
jgi:uncharacterized membrane protein